MKAIGMASLYSGMQNPERELTHEQVGSIVKLAEDLTQAWDGPKLAGYGLGPDHYAVYWQDGEDHCGLMTESSGFVRLWKKGDADWARYRDTVGLWTHLTQYVGPAHQKWLEDMKKEAEAAEAYQEGHFSVFKIPKA